jgi:hypothetical protein
VTYCVWTVFLPVPACVFKDPKQAVNILVLSPAVEKERKSPVLTATTTATTASFLQYQSL